MPVTYHCKVSVVIISIHDWILLQGHSWHNVGAEKTGIPKSTPKAVQLWIDDINSPTTTTNPTSKTADSLQLMPQPATKSLRTSDSRGQANKSKPSNSKFRAIPDPSPELASELSQLQLQDTLSDGEQDTAASTVPEFESAPLETVVCPTVTQTVYLRPKTRTRTVNVIRSRAHLSTVNAAVDATGQAYDYVTRPDAADQDLQSRKKSRDAPEDTADADGDVNCAQKLRNVACAKPSFATVTTTEFRSFVYLSTQFIYTTSPIYGAADNTEREVIRETMTVPVTVYAEPVTQTVTVTEVVQPSIQYPKRKPNPKLIEEGSDNTPVLTVTSTVTVRAPQFCPLSCSNDRDANTAPSYINAPSVQRVVQKPAINPTPLRKRCQFPTSKGQQFRVISAAYPNDDTVQPAKTVSPGDRWKRQLGDNDDNYASNNLAKIMHENHLQYPVDQDATTNKEGNSEPPAHPYPHEIIRVKDPPHPAHLIRPRKYREHNPNAPAHELLRSKAVDARPEVAVADSVPDADMVPDTNRKSASYVSEQRQDKNAYRRIMTNSQADAQPAARQPVRQFQTSQMENSDLPRGLKKRPFQSRHTETDQTDYSGFNQSPPLRDVDVKNLFKAVGRSDDGVNSGDDAQPQNRPQNSGHFIEIYC
ncbi:uncharacterized protein LOC129597996 [Paramacrobiotus metropolitanus]|uniref:uncharacterized protein LOC129597996 n=1 Tax=Paramacrobiotus metropolitanus TaxID=2943436 RepID=UPI0024456038|nr:uncharacterized protein LOC129597996 [Paramacrobiotus metropolitanus]